MDLSKEMPSDHLLVVAYAAEGTHLLVVARPERTAEGLRAWLVYASTGAVSANELFLPWSRVVLTMRGFTFDAAVGAIESVLGRPVFARNIHGPGAVPEGH